MNNEVIQAIYDRKSIRKYKEQEVTQAELEKLVDAALQAPSARNLQPWQMIVVRDQALLQDIHEAVKEMVQANGVALPDTWHLFHHAPAVVMLPREEASQWSGVDSGIVAQTLALAAQGLDLGTCMIGFIRTLENHVQKEAFYQRLHIPEGYQLDLCVSVGYPDEKPEARPRERKVEWHS